MNNVSISTKESNYFKLDGTAFKNEVNVYNGANNISRGATSPISSLSMSSPLSYLIGVISMIFGAALLVNITDGARSNYHLVSRDSLNDYMTFAKANYRINDQKPQDFSAGYFFQTIHIKHNQ